MCSSTSTSKHPGVVASAQLVRGGGQSAQLGWFQARNCRVVDGCCWHRQVAAGTAWSAQHKTGLTAGDARTSAQLCTGAQLEPLLRACCAMVVVPVSQHAWSVLLTGQCCLLCCVIFSPCSYPFEIHDDALVLRKMLEHDNAQKMAAAGRVAKRGRRGGAFEVYPRLVWHKQPKRLPAQVWGTKVNFGTRQRAKCCWGRP